MSDFIHRAPGQNPGAITYLSLLKHHQRIPRRFKAMSTVTRQTLQTVKQSRATRSIRFISSQSQPAWKARDEAVSCIFTTPRKFGSDLC
jgi:hypothetical protein